MIEKKSASEIHSLGGTYTTLPNQSLWDIGDATSLGIWALLISKPKSWKINRDNVCSALNVKPRQYYAAINRLKEVGLCREFCIRQNGKLKGKEIVIVSGSHDWERALAKLGEYAEERCVRYVDVTTKSLARIKTKKEQESSINAENDVCRDSQKQRCRETELSVAEFSAGENSADATSLYNKEEIKEEEIKEAAARIPKQEVDFDTSSGLEKPVSAAADFSGNNNSPNNSLIGDKLTLSQINAVKQKLSHIALNPGETPASLQHAVLTSLVDGAQFTACHPHFAKKLNAICKCYREGGYSPQSVLALNQQVQKDKKHQQHQKRLSSLEQDFRELRGDIQHFERVLRGNLPVEEITPMLPTYAEKKRRLSQLKTEIDALNEAMGQNTNNLSCPEKSIDLEQKNRPLSTDLPTKNVDKLATDIGDSNLSGEGVC